MSRPCPRDRGGGGGGGSANGTLLMGRKSKGLSLCPPTPDDGVIIIIAGIFLLNENHPLAPSLFPTLNSNTSPSPAKSKRIHSNRGFTSTSLMTSKGLLPALVV